MADIEVIEKLDRLDRFQVLAYRLGLSIAGLALCLPLPAHLELIPADYCQPLLILAAVLMASSLHVYSKSVRFFLSHATWLALLIQTFSPLWMAQPPPASINGLLLITVSGVAYKESFCFKIPGLKSVPLLLILAVITQFYQLAAVYVASSALAGMIIAWAALAKWRMPLHYDIGDKSKYQL